MVYTLSYSSIHESEKSLVGNRALNMSKAVRKNMNSSLFFVVTSDCFKEFSNQNSLSEKIKNLLDTNISEDYLWNIIKDLFSDCSIPEKVSRELKESYYAMSISRNGANNILRNFDARVNLFVSSDISDGLSSVFLNVKGFDNVLNAIKSCWWLFLKSKGVNYLKNNIDNFSAGVIVEKFVSCDFSVEVEVSDDEKNIILSAYKGLPEVAQSITKDLYILSFNHLEFINYELNHQNFSILHQEESGVLLKKRLGKEGSDNKASKQIISECARLAKRVFSVLDKFVKVYFVVKKDVPFLFLIDDVFLEEINDNKLKNEEVNDIDVSPFVNDVDSNINNNIMDDNIDNFYVKKVNKINIASSVESDSFSYSNEKEFSDFADSDEFIVQDEGKQNVFEEDSFSSFFKLVDLLEEHILNIYKESFGFVPSNFEEAVYELDAKHGFVDKEKVIKVFGVKSLIMQGEEVDEDIVFSLCGVIEDYLRGVSK